MRQALLRTGRRRQPQHVARHYLRGLQRGALLLLSFLLLLLQLLNALLQHVRPEVPLKVGQLLASAGEPCLQLLVSKPGMTES